MTFSLAVVDPLHGLLGAASASRSLAVGNAVMIVDPARGVSISQAATNRGLHGALLASLKAPGATPESALAAALATDDQPQRRQCGVLDLTGRGAAHTGEHTVGWAGHSHGGTAAATGWEGPSQGSAVHIHDGIHRPSLIALGNCLAGPEVLEAMTRTVRSPGSGDALALSLVQALIAADEAGGDIRGRQSAAVMVARIDPEASWPFTSIVDLRVDDDPQAPTALRALLGTWLDHAAERRLVGRR